MFQKDIHTDTADYNRELLYNRKLYYVPIVVQLKMFRYLLGLCLICFQSVSHSFSQSHTGVITELCTVLWV